MLFGGVALDSRHSNLKNALILAAEFGNLPIVEKLLNKKILDINSCDQEGDTPLHWAVYKGQTETVKLLLQRGASLDPLGFDGSTTHTAASRAESDAAQSATKLLSSPGYTG